jgi:hypothetical protein
MRDYVDIKYSLIPPPLNRSASQVVVSWCCMRKKYGSIPTVVETILINSTRDKKELSRMKKVLEQA